MSNNVLSSDAWANQRKSSGIDNGGEPLHDGGMEARVAKLETTVDYIQRDIAEIKLDIREMKKDSRVDFRLLFGAILTMGAALGGLMAKGFHWF